MFTGIIEEIGHVNERRQQSLQYRQKKSLREHI